MTQVDRTEGLVGNTAVKAPVRLASSAALSLLNGLLTVDGVVTAAGDRVLLTAQANAVNNGIWVVDTGNWDRAADCDGPHDLARGSLIKVNAGSNAGYWACTTTTDPIVVGTTGLSFALLPSVLTQFEGILTVDDFRQPTDPAGDDTLPVQAFWDFVFSNDDVVACYSGDFNITDTITIGPSVAVNQNTRFIFGAAIYRATAAIDICVKFRNTQFHTFHGDFQVIGTGNYVYANRTCDIGVAVEGLCAATIITGAIWAQYFKHHAVFLQTGVLSAGGQAEWFSVNRVLASGCGSGITDRPTYSVQATYSSLTNSGSSNSYGQRTTMDVTVLPPSFLDATYGAIGSNQTYINLDGEYYHVTAIDRGTSKITVFPWVVGAAASGTMTYVFGCGIASAGSDSNVLDVQTLTALDCGVGLGLNSGVPGSVSKVTIQSSGVAAILGAPQQVFQGSGFASWYSEANDCDLIVASNSIDDAYWNFSGVFTIDYEKIQFIAASDGTLRTHRGLKQITMPINGTFPRWQKLPQNLDSTNGFADITIDDGEFVRSFKGDNFTVRLTAYDANRDTLYGQTSMWIMFWGTGPNARPTGSVVIDANTIAGKTINGTNTVTYSLLRSPLLVQVSVNPATGNFTATPMRTLPAPQAAITAPSGGATVDTQARTAINSILTLLTAADLMS